MDKWLQPHAYHCRQLSSKFKIMDFFRLFLRFLTSNVTICQFFLWLYPAWKSDKALWYFREKWYCTWASDRSNSHFFSLEDWSHPFHRCEPVAKIDANQSYRSLRTPLRRNGVHQPWHGIPSLFHILTIFLHIDPISLLTNRPCHGPRKFRDCQNLAILHKL